jgi:diketogulonate reductase-like aldo/keto reductase
MHLVAANGADIPALGFGTWELRGSTAQRLVEAALQIGYRHLDTAQMYGNEAEVGAGLRASGLPRDAVFLTTKIWPDRFRAGDLERSVDESLRKLRLESVDLLLLHWPSREVPLKETMGALNRVHAAGRARHIGISNFTTAMIDEAVQLSQAPLATDQVEYHPMLGQRAVLASCRRHGMALTAYCPLARGRVFANQTLRRIGERHGRGAGQIALRWLVQQPDVVAIPRSSSETHARSNFAVFDFALSKAEMEEITALGIPADRVVNVASVAPTWDAK